MEVGTLTKLKLKATVVTFGKTPGRKIPRLTALSLKKGWGGEGGGGGGGGVE